MNNTWFSGYLQQTTEILPKLSLTPGLRYTVDRRQTTVVQYTDVTAGNPNKCQVLDDNGVALPLNPALPYNGCTAFLEKTFTSPTWTISLDYKLDANKLICVTSRRGYRTGGFNGRSTATAQRAPFNPETVTDFVAGLTRCPTSSDSENPRADVQSARGPSCSVAGFPGERGPAQARSAQF